MLLVTAEEMRALDRLTIERYGTPGHVLMERAGRGATRALLELFPYVRRKGRRVLVCAGKGNNGGDGFVMARLLRAKGVRTEVVLLAEASDVGGDAERNLRAYRKARGALREVSTARQLAEVAERFAAADVIVDAILGTGLASAVRGIQADVIELINSCGVPVFAVDMPSGLDADTGLPRGSTVQAEATATFGFAKVGQVLHPGVEHCGTLAVVDIGIAPQAVLERPPRTALIDAADAAALLPLRRAEAHKGDCGHVLVIAGSFGKTGAAQLVTRAAARAGAGLVTLCGPLSLYSVYASAVLEAMTEALPDEAGHLSFAPENLSALVGGKSAIVVGPGIGTGEGARRTVEWLLARSPAPLVLDADGLNCIAADTTILRRASAPLILTPHPGEMGRLIGRDSGAVQADRVGTAREFAHRHGCTLVLKGARTVVASPSSWVWVNPTGNPGMASGGMGDALSGILGGLLAQGLEADEAARLGVYLHGAAADRAAADGEIGLLASDVIAALRPTMQELKGSIGA
jgi:NAD(P)H-hydrate epimerase